MSAERRAEIGRKTTARLRRTEGVQGVEGIGLDLYVRQNFLHPAECATLIAMTEARRRPSTIFAIGDDDPGFRTSESGDLDRSDAFVAAIDARISGLLGIKERHGETIQGQRYAVGQVFKAHHDWFVVDSDYWAAQRAHGGQRTWTTMIYLDEPVAGGETVFARAGLTVTPRTAMLLAWNNMDASGQPSGQALHESVAVTAGVKTIITKWFRENIWA